MSRHMLLVWEEFAIAIDVQVQNFILIGVYNLLHMGSDGCSVKNLKRDILLLICLLIGAHIVNPIVSIADGIG